jgi:Xaa-Pro aminopeptidase
VTARISVLTPGRTANEAMEEVRHAMVRVGSSFLNKEASSTPRGKICKYAGHGDRKMKKGNQFAMLMECSEAGGYVSEMMPTFRIGKVPEELQRVFDDVVEVQKILVDMARPGADPMEL